MLVRCEMQFLVQPLQKLFVQNFRQTRLGRVGLPQPLIGGCRMNFNQGRRMTGCFRTRMLGVLHQQSARDDARAENDDSGKNDFPVVHGAVASL